MWLLMLHILLVILSIANVIVTKNRTCKLLWVVAALCWLTISVVEITEMFC